MTPMAKRPAEMATRTVPGHWDGDLIKCTPNGSAIGMLVERTTRLVILSRMDGTDDRWNEVAEHELLAQRLAIHFLCLSV